METEQNYASEFKGAIEKIANAEIDKRGITKYISAIIKKVNSDGTVDVCIPPNLNSVITGLLNKTGEELTVDDSVEICAKNGTIKNAWVAIKHKTSTLFAGINLPNTFTQVQTFNGQINLPNYNRIYWKEPGYGDKFAIEPQFSGADDQNYLAIGAAVGGAGTDPDTYNVATITGKSGNAWVKGNFTASGKMGVGTVARNTTDTWIPVIKDGYFDYTQRKIVSGISHTNHPNDQDFLATLSFLSWWNGAYNSDGSSNLRRCAGGEIASKPTVLYNNTSGSNGNITLSSSAANFEYIEIFYRSNDNNYSSVRVYQPNGKSVSLMSQDNNSSSTWLKVTVVTISGTTITKGGAVETTLKSGSSPTTSASNNNYITRVVGYN